MLSLHLGAFSRRATETAARATVMVIQSKASEIFTPSSPLKKRRVHSPYMFPYLETMFLFSAHMLSEENSLGALSPYTLPTTRLVLFVPVESRQISYLLELGDNHFRASFIRRFESALVVSKITCLQRTDIQSFRPLEGYPPDAAI